MNDRKFNDRRFRLLVLTQNHLGWRFWRKPEQNECEGGEEDAGQDEDVVVERGDAFHLQLEGQVDEGFLAARVVVDVLLGRIFDQLPLVAGDVVVDAERLLSVVEERVQLESVVSPGAELHLAALRVEGKLENVDCTVALEDGWRDPHDLTSVLHHCKCLSVFLQPRVGAG